ncbi:MAG: VPLPA-CTERM sorting domain-containing protein [Proteobacteria bacterium]|nr:VPLPA-CTERM sorting domain-containing protein [Pseudomonadota bacterium]
MKKFVFFKLFAALVVSIILMAPTLAMSAPIVYNLQSDWSKTDNPNGAWTEWKGSTILPHQKGTGDPFSNGFDFFAMGNSRGNFLPAWWKDTDGNVYTHSWDSSNGGSYGKSILTWTAPQAGTISLSGSIWYAQPGLDRSNDFYLYIGDTLLASGTISEANHNGKANALAFLDALYPGQTLTDLTVGADDVVKLLIVQSSGQTYGTVSGVELTIAETAAPVPLPSALLLFAPGLAGLAVIRRRFKK